MQIQCVADYVTLRISAFCGESSLTEEKLQIYLVLMDLVKKLMTTNVLRQAVPFIVSDTRYIENALLVLVYQFPHNRMERIIKEKNE